MYGRLKQFDCPSKIIFMMKCIVLHAYVSCLSQIGLSRDETYRILLALKNLTKQFQLTSVRFWGKVFGTQNDYLIAEGDLEGDDEDQDEEEEEDEDKKVPLQY